MDGWMGECGCWDFGTRGTDRLERDVAFRGWGGKGAEREWDGRGCCVPWSGMDLIGTFAARFLLDGC